MASQLMSESWPCIDVIDYRESGQLDNEMQVLEIVGATLFEDSHEDYYRHVDNERLRSLIQSLEAEINHNIPCATTTTELDQLHQHLLMDRQDSCNELCTASTTLGSMDGQDCWSTPIDNDLDQFEWVDSEHVAASSPLDDMNWWVEPVCGDNGLTNGVIDPIGGNICEDFQMYCGGAFRGSNLWQ